MAEWQVIAQVSSSDDLKTVDPSVDNIPAGTIGLVTIEDLPWWLPTRTFDLAYAEQTLGNHLAPAHAKVLDCYESGGKAYIRFEVTGSPVVPILIALAVALAVIGVSAAVITVAIKSPGFFDPSKWIAPGLLGVAALLLLSDGSPRQGNPD
jgi:hypothetical protein